MLKRFAVDSESVKIKEILQGEFLELEFKAISTAYPNRNKSHFTKEALQKAIGTCYNKPILGSFSKDTGDFRSHESELEYDEDNDNIYFDNCYSEGEVPIGLIRLNDKVEVREGADGLDWLHFSGAIWSQYAYRQAKALLNGKTNKVSVEVMVNDYEYDEDGIEIIKDFTLNGITVLGDHVETGIADAKLSIPQLMERPAFQKRTQALKFALEGENPLDISIEGKEEQNPMAKKKMEQFEEEIVEVLETEHEEFEAEAEAEKCAEEPEKEEEAKDTEEPEKEEEAKCEEEAKSAEEEPAKEEEAKEEEAAQFADEEPAKEEEAADDKEEEAKCEEEVKCEEEACDEKCAEEEKPEEEACDTKCAEEEKPEEEACGGKEDECGDGSCGFNLEDYVLKSEFDALQEKYNALVAEVNAKQIEALVQFGRDFVAEESAIDEEVRNQFAEEIREKCAAMELTSEEMVRDFAEQKIALHIYRANKNQESHKDFEVEVVQEHFEAPVQKNTLLEAINKLQRI